MVIYQKLRYHWNDGGGLGYLWEKPKFTLSIDEVNRLYLKWKNQVVAYVI